MTTFTRIATGLTGYGAPMILGPDGNFWFQGSSSSISRLTPAGVESTYTFTASGFGQNQICTDGTHLYAVSDNGIVEVTTSGSVSYNAVSGMSSSYTQGLLWGHDGNIWVAQYGVGLLKVDPSAWTSTAYGVSSYGPTCLWDDGTYIWTNDEIGGLTYKWTTSGSHTTIAVSGGSAIAFGGIYINPYNWQADQTGGLYRIDSSNAFTYHHYFSGNSTSTAIVYDGTYMWFGDAGVNEGCISVSPITPGSGTQYGLADSAQIYSVALGSNNQPYAFGYDGATGTGVLWGPAYVPPITMQSIRH